jgi:hypothetical protein
MKKKHDIAVSMIDARFEMLETGTTSAALHAETSMSIEMAHSLGVIDVDEYRHYRNRLKRIYDSESLQTMERMRSYG